MVLVSLSFYAVGQFSIFSKQNSNQCHVFVKKTVEVPQEKSVNVGDCNIQ